MMAGENLKVAMLYSGGHPIHLKFGDIVGAKPLHIRAWIEKSQDAISKTVGIARNAAALPSDFDVMLTESCFYYPALRKKLGMLGRTKIVNLSCSPLFYHMLAGRISGVERRLLMELLKGVDGHLVLGRYGEETLRKVEKGKPSRTVYPFIIEKTRKELESVVPEYRKNEATIIATNDFLYKGLDIAIAATIRAWEEDKGIRLNVIGNIPREIISKVSGGHPAINYIGFVPGIADALSRNSLYLHPARGDTFPVSVLEAMAAGLPAIVSVETGAKEAIEKADSSFVKPLEAEGIAKGMLDYFGMEEDEKEALGKRFREESEWYCEETQLKRFKNSFLEILDELGLA